jgi:histidinol-phosphate aminotransferase
LPRSLSAIKEQFQARLADIRLNRYLSPVTQELHHKLAASRRCGTAARKPALGNGADDMLYHIFLSVREHDQAFALSLTPSYLTLKHSARRRLKIRFLELNEDFSFSTEEYLKLASHPDCRMAILCNPINPTGNLFQKSNYARSWKPCQINWY